MGSRKNAGYVTLICLAGIFFYSSSCIKNLTQKNLIYFNDFERGELNNIAVYDVNGLVSTVKIEDFNGSKVLGRFNNNTFVINFQGLPTHNAIQVEFDLNIHDAWDGNFLGPTHKPDIWVMSFDNNAELITTFSNNSNQQAYPGFYNVGNTSPGKGNAWNALLPGVCSLKGITGGSSSYKIVKTLPHSGSNFTLSCNDALQPFNSLCTKSWSIDNLAVTAIKY